MVPVIVWRWRGYLDVRCFDDDRSCSDRRARTFAKESGDWIQNCRRVADCSVYGLVGLSQLKGTAMLAFDKWIQKKHPELLTEFNKLPKVKKTQTFYHWARENHSDVVLKEWPAVARIRARHLKREIESE